jgi:hypothetical protein
VDVGYRAGQESVGADEQPNKEHPTGHNDPKRATELQNPDPSAEQLHLIETAHDLTMTELFLNSIYNLE